jgi:hypothetical protein
MAQYVDQNRHTINYSCSTNELAELIRREGEAASYECLRVAADCLQRTFVLHRGYFPSSHPEEFKRPPDSSDTLPLHLLFRGSW